MKKLIILLVLLFFVSCKEKTAEDIAYDKIVHFVDSAASDHRVAGLPVEIETGTNTDTLCLD